MEAILDQIRATFDCGIWYPVISSTLMLPDACGAVEFWGQAKPPRERYADWYDRWVLPDFDPKFVKFDGAVVYIVRNAMIHESTGFTRGKHGFDRILFMPPNRGIDANFNFTANCGGVEEAAFQVSIARMLDAMERGVRNWLQDVRADADKRRLDAIDKLVQYRPNGQPPHIVGLPLIS